MRKFLIVALAGAAFVWLSAQTARADVKPNALFCDGMVVQRGVPVTIWGTADPDEKIDIATTFTDSVGTLNGETSVTADKNGNWKRILMAKSVRKK